MPLNERARHSPKSIFGRVGAGVAQVGVSRRGRRFVVRASRSLRGAKKHRTAAVFRVSVASHLPARIPIVGPICAMGCAALSACDRRNFTSVISRPDGGMCACHPKHKPTAEGRVNFGSPGASKRTKVTSYVKLPFPVARTRALSFLASKGWWATSPAFGSGSVRAKFFLYGHTKQARAGHREKPRRRRHTTTFFEPN